MKRHINRFVKKNFKLIIFTEILLIFIITTPLFHFNKSIVATLVVLTGVITQAFTSVWAIFIQFLSTVPHIGPYLVKFFSWPVLILLNFMTFLITYIATALGKGRRLLDSKFSATVFIIGLLLGFILGKIF